MIEELLNNACPSIQLRIRTEILGKSLEGDDLIFLQHQILKDNLVQEAFSWQGTDGWGSSPFHGYKSIEAGIRVLCEKGVAREHPAIKQALKVLIEQPRALYRGIGRPGSVLDDRGFGGSQMIRAFLFALAGVEQDARIEEQLKVALQGFDFIRSVDHIEDATSRYKHKLVFKPGVLWPTIYHLRLLAYTQGWRTPENYTLVIEGIRKLVQFSPIPEIHVRDRSHLIAPASFGMQDFKPNIETMSDAEWMMWFQRMELLARMGVLSSIVELQAQVDKLDEILHDENGWFTRALSHDYFMNWGAYTGLSLEKDWRSPKRRMYDLTFRSLVIKHYQKGQFIQPAGGHLNKTKGRENSATTAK